MKARAGLQATLRVQKILATIGTEGGESSCDQERKREDPRNRLDSASQRPQENVGARDGRQDPANPKKHEGSNDQADPPGKVDQIVE